MKRFVLVTSIGTGDSAGAPPKPVYDVLEKVLVEKAKAEEYLQVCVRLRTTAEAQDYDCDQMT